MQEQFIGSEESVKMMKEAMEEKPVLQRGIKVTDATPATADTYEARKKAFKQAGRRQQGMIPVTKNSHHFTIPGGQGNNRTETNSRGVNPRMFAIQRENVVLKTKVGKHKVTGEDVYAVQGTPSIRKIYHLRNK